MSDVEKNGMIEVLFEAWKEKHQVWQDTMEDEAPHFQNSRDEDEPESEPTSERIRLKETLLRQQQMIDALARQQAILQQEHKELQEKFKLMQTSLKEIKENSISATESASHASLPLKTPTPRQKRKKELVLKPNPLQKTPQLVRQRERPTKNSPGKDAGELAKSFVHWFAKSAFAKDRKVLIGWLKIFLAPEGFHMDAEPEQKDTKNYEKWKLSIEQYALKSEERFEAFLDTQGMRMKTLSIDTLCGTLARPLIQSALEKHVQLARVVYQEGRMIDEITPEELQYERVILFGRRNARLLSPSPKAINHSSSSSSAYESKSSSSKRLGMESTAIRSKKRKHASITSEMDRFDCATTGLASEAVQSSPVYKAFIEWFTMNPKNVPSTELIYRKEMVGFLKVFLYAEGYLIVLRPDRQMDRAMFEIWLTNIHELAFKSMEKLASVLTEMQAPMKLMYGSLASLLEYLKSRMSDDCCLLSHLEEAKEAWIRHEMVDKCTPWEWQFEQELLGVAQVAREISFGTQDFVNARKEPMNEDVQMTSSTHSTTLSSTFSPTPNPQNQNQNQNQNYIYTTRPSMEKRIEFPTLSCLPSPTCLPSEKMGTSSSSTHPNSLSTSPRKCYNRRVEEDGMVYATRRNEARHINNDRTCLDGRQALMDMFQVWYLDPSLVSQSLRTTYVTLIAMIKIFLGAHSTGYDIGIQPMETSTKEWQRWKTYILRLASEGVGLLSRYFLDTFGIDLTQESLSDIISVFLCVQEKNKLDGVFHLARTAYIEGRMRDCFTHEHELYEKSLLDQTPSTLEKKMDGKVMRFSSYQKSINRSRMRDQDDGLNTMVEEGRSGHEKINGSAATSAATASASAPIGNIVSKNGVGQDAYVDGVEYEYVEEQEDNDNEDDGLPIVELPLLDRRQRLKQDLFYPVKPVARVMSSASSSASSSLAVPVTLKSLEETYQGVVMHTLDGDEILPSLNQTLRQYVTDWYTGILEQAITSVVLGRDLDLLGRKSEHDSSSGSSNSSSEHVKGVKEDTWKGFLI